MSTITLDCVAGPLKGQTFRLEGGPVFIFGRYAKATFSLAGDPAASHLHFLIDISDNRVRIADLGSTNGLIINDRHLGGKLGDPLTGFVSLRSGDTILAGACLFRLVIQDSDPFPGINPFADANGNAPGKQAKPGTTVISKQDMADDPAATAERIPLPTTSGNLPEGVLPEIEGFTIIGKIGGGGKGIVYRAIADDSGVNAAIKMLVFDRNKRKKQRALEMFRREIQITRQLRHPHIVRYLADGVSLGAPYLALEYIDGGNMATLIQNAPFRRLDLPQAIPLFLQLLEAVAYMHSQGLVHRDIKPNNVLLELRRGGSLAVKLSDMGLTSRSSNDSASDFLPIVCEGGTPAYMPPEQLTDLTRAIPQSDVFSTAATFYHMVTGSPLYDFSDRDHNEIVIDSDIRPIQSLRPDLPSSIAAVVTKALSYDPGNRYPDGQTMQGAFNRALA